MYSCQTQALPMPPCTKTTGGMSVAVVVVVVGWAQSSSRSPLGVAMKVLVVPLGAVGGGSLGRRQ